MELVDIDSDGLLDVLGSSAFDDMYSVYMNLGNGVFGTRETLDPTGHAGSIVGGDFNLDGHIEAWVTGANGPWIFAPQAGALTPAHQVTSTFGVAGQYVSTDVDEDGDLDIVGMRFGSTTPGSVFPVSNSVGTLCVIGSVGRGIGGGIVNSGSDGYFYGSVNLNGMPQPTGTVAVLPGDTWHFQAWHRDASGGQTTSNFTDAVAVTFQ